MQQTTYGGRVLMSAVLGLAAVCTACSPRAHTAQHYQKDGVQFTYYSDWQIVKDAAVNGNVNIRAIHIEGPEHAVVSLICVPPESTQTLEHYAAAVAEKRNEAIEAKLKVGSIVTASVTKGTSEATSGKVAGRDRQGILQHFTIDLLSVQVPHEATFYVVQGTRYKILVMSQVATANAEATHTGSEMILSTLVIEGAS